ncbi:MAG: prepilin-type N-terminal cleavage/methylation domain-containing protein, partial [Pseudomonadota bacterium]
MQASTSPIKVLRRSAGFTLIEILIVVVLVGIILGVVVSSFTGVDQEQVLRGYAERLSLRIELARDKALQANREWGMYIDEAGVRFAVYDETTGEWIPQAGKHFVADEYGASLDFEVEVESFEGQLATTEPDTVESG